MPILTVIALLRYRRGQGLNHTAAELREVEQVICHQCQASNEQGSTFCGKCGTSLDLCAPSPSASQYPRTPDEQYLPDNRAGRYIPGSNTPSSQFRPDLRRLSRAEQTAGGATLVLLISLFLPWFGFSAAGGSVNGTGAHRYLVIVVLLAVLMAVCLLHRSGWEEVPFRLPARHETVLLTVAGLQFLLVASAFFDVPVSGLSWEFGAYLSLIASAAVVAAAVTTAIRLRQAGR